MSRLFLIVTLLASVDCHVDLNEESTDPRKQEFYFPVGLAIDPDPAQRYLYVTGGNSDLKYGGGTLQMVDLERFFGAVNQFNAGCAGGDCGLCESDRLDPNVVNCDETAFVLGNATAKIGNFAGTIRVQRTGADTRRLFLAVRGDPSITWADVNFGKIVIRNGRADADVAGLMDCYDHPELLPASPEAPVGCDSSHLLQQYPCSGRPNCVKGFDTIPPEPFNLVLDEGNLTSGEPYKRLVVSHLADGKIMLVDILGAPLVRDVSGALFGADAAMRRGAFAMAPQRASDPSAPWYLTSNLQPTIATFRIADIGVVVPSVAFTLSGQFAQNNDLRDIVFEEGGNRAFVTVNTPPSLAVIDTRPNTVGPSPGNPINQVVDVVDVCQIPSQLAIRYVATSAGRRPRLYVSCFLSNQIMVVDPDGPGVLDTILVGRGPNEIVFDQDPARPFAYVTHFSENSIGVIDLRPGSATENRMIARIGLPVPPKAP